MAGKVDAFLKICVAVALLAAAGSVGYYFAIYLPARDVKLDKDRQLERARAEFSRRSEAERVQAEKNAAEQKAAAERAMARVNYDACLSRAESQYDRAWAFGCKQVADRAQKSRAECTSDKSFCDKLYPLQDGSPNCSLARSISSSITDDYDKAKDRCLQESKSGLQ